MEIIAIIPWLDQAQEWDRSAIKIPILENKRVRGVRVPIMFSWDSEPEIPITAVATMSFGRESGLPE